MAKNDKLENIVSLLKEQREFLEKKYKIKEIGKEDKE